MLASKLHWRVLIGTILLLMAGMLLLPKFAPAPIMQENRALADAPSLPRSWKEAEAFRAGADAYIADRFPARAYMIPILNRIRMMAGVTGSNRVLIGQDGWLFFDNDSHLGAARNDPPLTPAEIRAWLAGLAGRTEMLRARGIPYLVVAAPIKETVYPEKAPRWFKRPAPDRPAVMLSRLARDTGAGDVIYMGDAVLAAKAKGRTVYSRHDTHWNGYGAYAGYRAMMSWLHAKGLTEGPVPLSNMRVVTQEGGVMPRDLSVMLGVASFVDLSFTHLIDDKATRGVAMTYITDRTDWTSPYVVETGRAGKPVLLITRDSFSTEMEPWLYNHFSRIILAHDQDGFFREDLIDRYKPDIVVIEVIESGVQSIMTPAPLPSAAALARIDAVLSREKITKPVAAPPTLGPTTAANAAILDAAIPGSCNLEISKLASVTGQAELTVGGWISEVAPRNTSPLGVVRLQGPGLDISAPIRVDRSRPDVATYFKQRAAEKSGFGDVFQVGALAPGDYQPTVYRPTATGWMSCVGLSKVTATR